MVGEIRDRETAEIAVNAALTGHLVLSTLHTNSAPAAFVRLIQMGVPKYLLADAITLVVAQRLVRKLCPYCAGAGCDQCNETGFKGRILIAEHYIPDQKTAELIKREATLGEFEQQFTALGNKTLLQDGLEKVSQGLTTEAEVRSVTE
jgi:type II secretory ATPase GspE/PulE/Tfp pilus assembly ATPase PilB-like protein